MVESSKNTSVWSRNVKSASSPFDILKKPKGKLDLTEIKESLNQFDSQRFNIADFVAACIPALQENSTKSVDQLIEYILSQPKIRDLFRLSETKADTLVDKLTSLIKMSKDLDAIELYTRLASHLAFCNSSISDASLAALLIQL